MSMNLVVPGLILVVLVGIGFVISKLVKKKSTKDV